MEAVCLKAAKVSQMGKRWFRSVLLWQQRERQKRNGEEVVKEMAALGFGETWCRAQLS